jgi:Fe-S cluster assembly protein SufD
VTDKIIENYFAPHLDGYKLLADKNSAHPFIFQKRLGAQSYLKLIKDEKNYHFMKNIKFKVQEKTNQKLPAINDINLNFHKANTFVFLNGIFSKNLSLLEEGRFKISSSFEKMNFENSLFGSLNHAYMNAPVTIEVIKKSKLPLHIIHINTASDSQMIFCNVSVLINSGLKLDVLETFLDLKDSVSMYNRALKIAVFNDSQISYKSIFNLKKSELALFNDISIGNSSTLSVSNNIKKLGTLYHDETISVGNDSQFINKSLFYKFKKCDYNFKINHESNSSSNILIKSCCKKNEKLNVVGDLIVGKNKEKIEAHEKFEALLMGDNSSVKFTPLLHIESEDVNVNHGSSITQLNPKEINYLESKGITAAQKLLIKSFLKI